MKYDNNGFGLKDFALRHFAEVVIPKHRNSIEQNPKAGLTEAVDEFLSEESTLFDRQRGRYATWAEALAR